MGLLLPAQLKTLSALARLAACSDVAVVLAIVFIIVSFGVSNRRNDLHHVAPLPSPDAGASGAVAATRVLTMQLDTIAINTTAMTAMSATTSLWPAQGVSFLEGYGSLSSFIFAFQGHSIFLEIMGQMKQPTRFTTAAWGANIAMGSVYLMTTAAAYYFVGSDVKGFLPFSLPDSMPLIKAAVGVLLCFHILVSYLLSAQPLTEYLHQRVSQMLCGRRGAQVHSHATVPTEEAQDVENSIHVHIDPGQNNQNQNSSVSSGFSVGGCVVWLLLSIILLGFAFFVANAVPFFSDFQNIVGSAIGAPILFGTPTSRGCRGRTS